MSEQTTQLPELPEEIRHAFEIERKATVEKPVKPGDLVLCVWYSGVDWKVYEATFEEWPDYHHEVFILRKRLPDAEELAREQESEEAK